MFEIIFAVLSVATCVKGYDVHSIEKRALLYTRSTVLQFSTGLTVPAVLPRRSINLNLVAQANYNLPYNVSNFSPLTISARDKEKTSYFDISRRNFYKYVIEFLDRPSLEYDARFQNHTKGDKLKFNERLLLAEKLGKGDVDCSDQYSDCLVSIVDLFTAKYII